MKTRRIVLYGSLVLAVLVLALLIPLVWLFTSGFRPPVQVPDPEYWPTDGWQTRSPEEMGFDSRKLADVLLALQDEESTIDSLLIIHDGYLVLDAYFAPYDGTFPHDLASVTKSVMTTLIGIAADQGYINLDQPVISYFPDRIISNLDTRKEHMTVRHLVMSNTGMESGCMEGDEETLAEMRSHPDWVQAALDRPMVSEPGTEFCYDSPGFHLLSAILQETTGMTAFDFALLNLFEPLGIHQVIWETDLQGHTRGWGDLHLLPVDAAKLGYLWLHQGNWDGQQVAPKDWVLSSVKAHSRDGEDEYGYGFGWWVSPVGYYASGRGGQNIRVFASLDTLVVTTGGDFDFPEIEPFLTPILLKLINSRPADPAGQAALASALATIQQDDEVLTALPSPGLLVLVSAATYQCEDNLAGIESLHIDFTDPAQASLSFRISGVDIDWLIGLDGTYRFTPEGMAVRGGWEDEQTFKFIVFDVGNLTRQVTFQDDNLQLLLPEMDLMIYCQKELP